MVIALLLLVAGLVPARPAVGQSTTCKIIFRSNRGGAYGLWVYHIDNGTFSQFLSGSGYSGSVYSPSFSPDGQDIVFVASGGIYINNGSNAVYNSSTVLSSSANWLPDGRITFFAQGDGGYYYPYIYDSGSISEYLLGGTYRTQALADTAVLDIDGVDEAVSFRHFGGHYYLWTGSYQIWASASPVRENAVLYNSEIYYDNASNIHRISILGTNDQIFLSNASRIRFDSGFCTFQRANEIYYSDGSASYRVTNDSYVDSQPDIWCDAINNPTPTIVPISGTVNLYVGYTLPTATANLTETDTPDYQGAMRGIADGASSLFDFSEPAAQLLTTLILVVVLTQVGMFTKAFARWRHGR